MAFSVAPPSVPGEHWPLASGQRDVWLDQMAWPGSSHLNIGGGAFLEGPLDLDRFRRALQQLVEETQSLRLIPLADGTQYYLGHLQATLDMVDVSTALDPKKAMEDWWCHEIRRPFEPGSPPWRFTLLTATDHLRGLTIQFHHSIMDGWGTTQIMRRWCELYNDSGTESRPPSPGYKDYVDESNAYLQSPAFERDAGYWTERFPSVPEPLIEPRFSTAAEQLPDAHLHVHHISRGAYDRVVQFASQQGCTGFELILSAIALYFARTRQRQAVTIGVPTLNRAGSRYLGTPGMFVGVMPITVQIPTDSTIASVLQSTHKSLREGLRHARFPLNELTSRLKLLREHRSNLFDVLLSFERQDYGLAFGAANLVESRQLFSGIARFPLGITLCEFAAGQDLEMIIEGNQACYTAGEVELLSRRLWNLALALVDQPDGRLDEIELVPTEERWALLEGLHQHLGENSDATPFPTLFVHQAQLRPAATALVWPNGSMSYSALEHRTTGFARHLLGLGIHRGDVIAVALERSPELIVALLGIQRAGATYLPLDPDTPVERIHKILASSSTVALVTLSGERQRFRALHAQTIEIDRLELSLHTRPDTLPAIHPDDLAYVLYTSGSTGEPKGVMVEHGALALRLNWLSEAYHVDWSDRAAQATQSTFDPSLIEICLPLIHGASIALPPPGRISATILADFVIRHEVTIMAFVPSTLERFLDALETADASLLKLRVACTGGEVLSAELAARFHAVTGARLYNVYGPTETVIFATAWPYTSLPAGEAPPIGRCIDNSRIYVLDQRMRLLPFGEKGEIHIGGQCIARGYLNQPDLTTQSFVVDPFQPGQMMYRSGDSGWLGCDGNLHFSGRRDRQIKLRGYRIELAEIESALIGCPGVTRAAVDAIETNGQTSLHAWATVIAGTTVAALRHHLSMLLPIYMLPAGFSLIQAMPETAAGKIDYRQLPRPGSASSGHAARPARPGLESDLVSLWSQVLMKPTVQVSDNFFDLGGDSLAIIDIISGLEQRLGRRIPLHLITENPTIELLAKVLDYSPSSVKSLVTLSTNHKNPPIYLVASGHGDLLRFKSLASLLASTYEVFMLQPPANADRMTLDDLADHYAAMIASRHRKHVTIAGFSVGGISGLETARRLSARGQPPATLILIDTLYPHALLRAQRLWRLSEWLIRLLHIQELSMNGRRLGALFKDAGLVMQVNALPGYTPAPYDGNVLLIKTSGLVAWQRWLFKPWHDMMPHNLTQTEIPGLHGSVFDSGNLEALAMVIRHQLPRSPDLA